MTGPEHYKEAERLLKRAAELTPPISEHDLRAIQERAQVHATLALAAATALGSRGMHHDIDDRPTPAGMHPADFIAWDDVAGVEGE